MTLSHIFTGNGRKEPVNTACNFFFLMAAAIISLLQGDRSIAEWQLLFAGWLAVVTCVKYTTSFLFSHPSIQQHFFLPSVNPVFPVITPACCCFITLQNEKLHLIVEAWGLNSLFSKGKVGNKKKRELSRNQDYHCLGCHWIYTTEQPVLYTKTECSLPSFIQAGCM